jgi:hypothetical protein
MNPPLQPYTLPSRSKSQTHEPKLDKESGCPNTRKEMKSTGIQQNLKITLRVAIAYI